MKTNTHKIAVLSDVHGNLPALEAVLTDCKKQCAEQIWNLGDFVGYVPYPNEVIELLQKENAVSIIGNYDIKVLSFSKKAGEFRKNKDPEKYSSFEWNYNALTDKNKTYLQNLPNERRITIEGYDILLTHGSPSDKEEGIGPMTGPGRLKELAKIAKADIVLSGHTHMPFKKQTGGVLFVNVGSAGRPEGDKRASYVILDFANGRVAVKHHKIKYDIKKALKAIHKIRQLAGLAEVIEKAKKLETLKEEKKKSQQGDVSDEKKLEAVLALAKKYDYEKQHTHQVEKLSLQLFDQLTELLQLSDKDRFLLRCGAILHDIGWIEGQKGHHKVALRIIMEDNTLPFDFRDKSIIGLLARYHRKRMPLDRHSHYRELNANDKAIVRKLAGILRLADGLDCSHRNLVGNLSCEIKGNQLLLTCSSKESLEEEFSTADEKADLLKQEFGKKIVFRRRAG